MVLKVEAKRVHEVKLLEVRRHKRHGPDSLGIGTNIAPMISDLAVFQLPAIVSAEDIRMANSTGLAFSVADCLAARENPHDI